MRRRFPLCGEVDGVERCMPPGNNDECETMKKICVKILSLAILSGWGASAAAQVRLAAPDAEGAIFPLTRGGTGAGLCYDPADYTVVSKAVSLLADDIQRVTGRRAPVRAVSEGRLPAECVIAGTVGHSRLIGRLAERGKLDTALLSGRWESYRVQVVENPLPGVRRALVVAGSDRRGTAYGLLSVSEAIGVSPWYWWADVPVVRRRELRLAVRPFVSKEPSVRYRGIFINDEDWGLLRWARGTFETDRGNIGPKTYAKVCELLLRLKGNYLCPAMHEASTAFNRIPENKMVADTFAIVMGSVHCEPLLFNNSSEWNRKTMGEWDYVGNGAMIDRVLRRRVEENHRYENVYTLALRGLHDKAMKGGADMKDRVKTLGDALASQRRILTEVTGLPAERIPQAFTPYKEVLDVYRAGLELPDDVTIIWPDDNYGYMKQLSSPRERRRSGRSGVYYHASYLGKPHDYLWLASTPPSLMYEELSKAYDATADRIWLLNAGDIKSCEFPVSLFLAMAYDLEDFSYERADSFGGRWLGTMFGDRYRDRLDDIVRSYYRLAFARKPEAMGWGYEWNSNKYPRERVTDTDFSFADYGEAESRLAEYARIAREAGRLMAELPDESRDAFYQLVYYPVKGAELMNRMHLSAQKNRWYAMQGRPEANALRDEVKCCHDSLQIITRGYNSLRGGKWNHVMSMVQGVTTSYFELPKNTETVTPAPQASLGLWVEGESVLRGMGSFRALPTFNKYTRCSYFFELFNRGDGPVHWRVEPSDDWIVCDTREGESAQARVTVRIDWDRVPVGDRVLGEIGVTAAGETRRILVSVFNPASPSTEEIRGLFVEDNGCVSIGAAGYHRKRENEHIRMRTIPGMGYEGVSVQLGDPLAPVQSPASSVAPCLEYDFYCFSRGSVDVYTYMLPTFPLTPEAGYAGHEATNVETRYGVTINDGALMRPSTSSFEYAQTWYENVLKNCRVNKTTLHVGKPGRNTVKIVCGDPGVVIQKIVLDFGGMKRSYLGPPPTPVAEN